MRLTFRVRGEAESFNTLLSHVRVRDAGQLLVHSFTKSRARLVSWRLLRTIEKSIADLSDSEGTVMYSR